jgi:hypothetical protein
MKRDRLEGSKRKERRMKTGQAGGVKEERRMGKEAKARKQKGGSGTVNSE